MSDYDYKNPVFKLEIPTFEVKDKDEDKIFIAEWNRKALREYYIEIDKLLSKKLVEALETENLKILRENINAELRNRRKKQ